MNQWWDGLTMFERVLWFLAVPSTLIFIIQSVLTFIGAGMEAMDSDLELPDDADTPDSGDLETSFNILTIKNLFIFIMIFSWAALTGLQNRWGITATILFSVFAAVVVVVAVSFLLYWAIKNQQSGNANLNNAVDTIASCYLRIPPKEEGKGKVHLKVDGRLMEIDAVTDGEEIPTGAEVKVLKVVKGRYVVVRKL